MLDKYTGTFDRLIKSGFKQWLQCVWDDDLFKKEIDGVCADNFESKIISI